MAVWMNVTEKQKKIWDDWVASRPPVIQEMIAKYDLRPEKIYRIRQGNERCVIHSLLENGSLTMNFLALHNQDSPLFVFERNVFGVKPEDLTPADYPFEIVDGSQFEDLEDEENGNEQRH